MATRFCRGQVGPCCCHLHSAPKIHSKRRKNESIAQELGNTQSKLEETERKDTRLERDANEAWALQSEQITQVVGYKDQVTGFQEEKTKNWKDIETLTAHNATLEKGKMDQAAVLKRKDEELER